MNAGEGPPGVEEVRAALDKFLDRLAKAVADGLARPKVVRRLAP